MIDAASIYVRIHFVIQLSEFIQYYGQIWLEWKI